MLCFFQTSLGSGFGRPWMLVSFVRSQILNTAGQHVSYSDPHILDTLVQMWPEILCDSDPE